MTRPRDTERTPAAPARAHRLSMSEVVDRLIAAQTLRAADHSSIKIGRTARGSVSLEVKIVVGELGVETVDEAMETAQELFDLLDIKYQRIDEAAGGSR